MKIFKDKTQEKNYNDYIKLLDTPYKLQSLLYHTDNLISNIQYYDVYEDKEKICISHCMRNVRIGNSSLYLSSMKKTGFTFKKTGPSNSRLSIWYGTNVLNTLNSLMFAKKIFNYEFKMENSLGYMLDYIHQIPPTKGLLSMIACNKIKTKEDYILYFAKNSLRLKKNVIDKFSKKDLTTFIESFCTQENQYILRDILITCNNHISFIKKYLQSKYSNSQVKKDYLIKVNFLKYSNLARTLKALNKKISWNQSELELLDLENECNIEIKNLISLHKLWNNGTILNLKGNTDKVFTGITLSDLPF